MVFVKNPLINNSKKKKMIYLIRCDRETTNIWFSKYLYRMALEAIAERSGSSVRGEKKSGVRSPPLEVRFGQEGRSKRRQEGNRWCAELNTPFSRPLARLPHHRGTLIGPIQVVAPKTKTSYWVPSVAARLPDNPPPSLRFSPPPPPVGSAALESQHVIFSSSFSFHESATEWLTLWLALALSICPFR